jgi:hypothetical protein
VTSDQLRPLASRKPEPGVSPALSIVQLTRLVIDRHFGGDSGVDAGLGAAASGDLPITTIYLEPTARNQLWFAIRNLLQCLDNRRMTF